MSTSYGPWKIEMTHELHEMKVESSRDPEKFLPDGRQWLWSANSLGDAKKCSRYYYYTQVLGWNTKEENVHLIFGGHYSKAIEKFHYLMTEWGHEGREEVIKTVIWNTLQDSYGQLDAEKLRDMRGSARYKTREHLIRSLVWYFDEFEDDPCKTITLSNGKPAVELPFQFKITNEISLRGRIDRLVEYSGEIYIQDQKTTGAQLGQWYFKRYNPDNQMSLYAVAAEVVYNTVVNGVMIDAAQIAVGFTRFERGFTFRTPEQNDEWLKDAQYWIERTWEAERTGWPMNDSACELYGGCAFRDVCAKSPQVRKDFLEGGAFERWT